MMVPCICSRDPSASSLIEMEDHCGFTEDCLPSSCKVPDFTPKSSNLSLLGKPKRSCVGQVGKCHPTIAFMAAVQPVKPEGDHHVVSRRDVAQPKLIQPRGSIFKFEKAAGIMANSHTCSSIVRSILKPSRYTRGLSSQVAVASAKEIIPLAVEKEQNSNIKRQSQEITNSQIFITTSRNRISLNYDGKNDRETLVKKPRKVSFNLKKKIFLIPYSPIQKSAHL